MIEHSLRDQMIEHAQQERMTRDTLILQKVNRVHREAFKTRFPGQIEHCMRLTAERLQAILIKKPEDLADPATWAATAIEIGALAEALHNLSHLNKAYPVEQSND